MRRALRARPLKTYSLNTEDTEGHRGHRGDGDGTKSHLRSYLRDLCALCALCVEAFLRLLVIHALDDVPHPEWLHALIALLDERPAVDHLVDG